MQDPLPGDLASLRTLDHWLEQRERHQDPVIRAFAYLARDITRHRIHTLETPPPD